MVIFVINFFVNTVVNNLKCLVAKGKIVFNLHLNMNLCIESEFRKIFTNIFVYFLIQLCNIVVSFSYYSLACHCLFL